MRTTPCAVLGAILLAGAIALTAVLAVTLPVPTTDGALAQDMPPAGETPPQKANPALGGQCMTCHAGTEEIHPWAPVRCVQCHGGDEQAAAKEKAHVKGARLPGDERTLPQGHDPDYLRFLDPGNLRIAHLSCGPCHTKAVDDCGKSLHATTSGHLGDGLYENGVVGEKHPPVSIFSVQDGRPADAPRPEGAVAALRQIGTFSSSADRGKLSSHFADLPRKACMQCHLWSRGRAVRGRAGMDGDYRGEGCSACHVPYADDGLSQSGDPTVNKFEPGHPKQHRMVRFPETSACTRCHYGDASIGLSFRGLAQPVPGMPQSPDAPGLHRKRLNGVYYIDDPSTTPADVHHQRGMHCVDCHTRNDTMGDGNLWKRMEDAVEITCEACHGSTEHYADALTRRGTKLAHLVRTKDGLFLRGRIDGKLRRLKQVRDIVRPGADDYNAAAAQAMNSDHADVSCHGCHSGWNPNFFGFHFDRNEQFTQLEILSGQRTPGRVTTQEKVFSTFKSFYLGRDSHGRAAPYMVGFSSMATVHGKEGEILLDQELPVTRAGLSGMTMIHHQTHTTTARARQCVECHRSPQALGRGSVNFRLGREFIAGAGPLGAFAVALDRKTPANSVAISQVSVADARVAALMNDRLTGRAAWLYSASASDGLVATDFSQPAFPRVAARMKAAVTDPQAALVAASRLFVADGAAGVRVFDVSQPASPRQIAQVPVPAFGLHLDGPHLFVAAGQDGLAVVDVRPGRDPVVLCEKFDLNGPDTGAFDARTVSVMFQFSRPHPDLMEGPRTRARNLAAVSGGSQVYLLDVTEPSAPKLLSQVPGRGVGGAVITNAALATVYELGSEGGAIPSRERDLLLVATNAPFQGVGIFDVAEPAAPVYVGGSSLRGPTRALRALRVYNPPFVQTFLLSADSLGMQITDISRPSAPAAAGDVAVQGGLAALDVEEFPLDRAVDADGKPILDVSHEGARWLSQDEFLRVLNAPLFTNPAPAGGGNR